MKKIVEIIDIGYPKCLIHREGSPIDELINTENLVKELNKQLNSIDVTRKLLVAYENFKLMTPRKFSCSEERIDAFLNGKTR